MKTSPSEKSHTPVTGKNRLKKRLLPKAKKQFANKKELEAYNESHIGREQEKPVRNYDGSLAENTKENSEQNSTGNDNGQFSQFVEIIKSSKSLDEAYDKARKIKNVPIEIADAFYKKYNPNENLGMKESFKIFYDEIKGGSMAKGGKISNNAHEVELIENSKDGKRWRGIVSKKTYNHLEDIQNQGGFRRFNIDLYDDTIENSSVNETGLKEYLKSLHVMFEVGGSMAKGGISGTLSTTYSNPLEYLKAMGAKVYSDLNYSTENGINYYIGEKDHKALVVAFIEDEDNYLITKEDAREMSSSAKTAGIESVELYTNYGVELHSRLEKPQDIGFDKIYKVSVVEKMAKGANIEWKDDSTKFIIGKKEIGDDIRSLKDQELYGLTSRKNNNTKEKVIADFEYAGFTDAKIISDKEYRELLKQLPYWINKYGYTRPDGISISESNYGGWRIAKHLPHKTLIVAYSDKHYTLQSALKDFEKKYEEELDAYNKGDKEPVGLMAKGGKSDTPFADEMFPEDAKLIREKEKQKSELYDLRVGLGAESLDEKISRAIRDLFSKNNGEIDKQKMDKTIAALSKNTPQYKKSWDSYVTTFEIKEKDGKYVNEFVLAKGGNIYEGWEVKESSVGDKDGWHFTNHKNFTSALYKTKSQAKKALKTYITTGEYSLYGTAEMGKGGNINKEKQYSIVFTDPSEIENIMNRVDAISNSYQYGIGSDIVDGESITLTVLGDEDFKKLDRAFAHQKGRQYGAGGKAGSDEIVPYVVKGKRMGHWELIHTLDRKPKKGDAEKHRNAYNESLNKGGANEHLGTNYRVTDAKIINQKTGEEVDFYKAPMFEAFEEGGSMATGGDVDNSGVEKIKKLGISYTDQFGEKYRDWLNKVNDANRNGEYVGYQLSIHDDKITVIGKKGTIVFNIEDYSNFPKHVKAVRASVVHYEKGGKANKNEITYKGKTITKLHPSGYYEVYSDKQERFVKSDELQGAKDVVDADNDGKKSASTTKSGYKMTKGGKAGKKRLKTKVAVKDTTPKTPVKKRLKKSDKEWDEIALTELREHEGDDNIEKGSDIDNDGFEAKSGSTSWLVFKNVDDAEQQAIDRVKDDLENNPEMFTQDWLNDFLSVSDTDRRIIANEEADRYVGDIEDEDNGKRVLEEAGMESEYEAEEDEEKKDKIFEEAKEKIHDDYYETWYNGLKDPVDFLVNEQGIYSVEDLLKQSFINIDIDEAAQDAVSTDGIGHFLGTYSGEQIDLPSGAVAYKN